MRTVGGMYNLSLKERQSSGEVRDWLGIVCVFEALCDEIGLSSWEEWRKTAWSGGV